MKKHIITGGKAKEQLLEGAELLYRAVSTTLGPKGQNAVIGAYGEPIVTHDGVTVAKAIEDVADASSGALVGIEMIKSSSSKTNDNVGDGTTSSTILAYQIMKDGMDMIKAGKNPMVLRRELEDAKDIVLTELEKLSEPITTEKATQEIATISSENDDIGREVGKMFYELGKDGMIAVEIGTKPKIEYEIVEGYTFERGLINNLMMNDTRTQSAVVENPAILLAHQTVSFKDIAPLLDDLYNAGKNGIVIICDDIKSDLLDQSLQQRDRFEIIAIKAPGFGDQRNELMQDLAALLGTVVVGNKQSKNIDSLSSKDLGACRKIISTPKETVITGGQEVTEYIKDLQGKLELTKGEFDKNKIERRIAQLRGKIGQIRVGGNTEMEAEERKYLVDDAVAATEAALKEGIVPGGGTTYLELAKRLEGATDGVTLLQEALQAPFKILMVNAGQKWGERLEKIKTFGQGFDVMGDDTLVDLKEHGIIDPVLVIKQAITNAVSVAGSALTTGVLITTEKDKDEKEEE